MLRLLRAPVKLYDRDLGWLLGRRFLMLVHIGRRSGRRYRTVLEVVGEGPEAREVIAVAGLGHAANWLRNIKAQPAIEVVVGRDHFRPEHRILEVEEAVAVLAGYEHRNRLAAPLLRRALGWLVGWRYDGSEQARRRLCDELPLIAFRPAEDDQRLPGGQRDGVVEDAEVVAGRERDDISTGRSMR